MDIVRRYWTCFGGKEKDFVCQLSCLHMFLSIISNYFTIVLLFSIMGEGEHHGIVPQFAKELFDRVEGTTDDEV